MIIHTALLHALLDKMLNALYLHGNPVFMYLFTFLNVK